MLSYTVLHVGAKGYAAAESFAHLSASIERQLKLGQRDLGEAEQKHFRGRDVHSEGDGRYAAASIGCSGGDIVVN